MSKNRTPKPFDAANLEIIRQRGLELQVELQAVEEAFAREAMKAGVDIDVADVTDVTIRIPARPA